MVSYLRPGRLGMVVDKEGEGGRGKGEGGCAYLQVLPLQVTAKLEKSAWVMARAWRTSTGEAEAMVRRAERPMAVMNFILEERGL